MATKDRVAESLPQFVLRQHSKYRFFFNDDDIPDSIIKYDLYLTRNKIGINGHAFDSSMSTVGIASCTSWNESGFISAIKAYFHKTSTLTYIPDSYPPNHIPV
jgi:hypothetical protein